MLSAFLYKTIYSVVEVLIGCPVSIDDTVDFVQREISRIPDIYRTPIIIITGIFGVHSILFKRKYFFNLSTQSRTVLINKVRSSIVLSLLFRDWLRLLYSLCLVKSTECIGDVQ